MKSKVTYKVCNLLHQDISGRRFHGGGSLCGIGGIEEIGAEFFGLGVTA